MDGVLANSRHPGADRRSRSLLEHEPVLGAHLTTSRRGYTHHGVYAGGREVRIVAHSSSPYSPQEIVRRARSRLSENDYRLLTNNCEHFCNWCRSGVSHSAQVERQPFRLLRALFHS
jgi:hypothetical protein